MKTPDHFLFLIRDTDGATLRLDVEETRHALTVLRLNIGDTIAATDGKGRLFNASISTIDHAGGVTASVISASIAARPVPAITFHVGLPEKDAFETAVETLTALGVDAIVPLVTGRCSRRWWRTGWEVQAARLQRKMIAAAKQSRNPFFPRLDEPQEFVHALERAGGTLVVADQNSGPFPELRTAGSVSCFVGPPGGFTELEAGALKSRNAVLMSLGPYRLRTELAAAMLCGCVRVMAR